MRVALTVLVLSLAGLAGGCGSGATVFHPPPNTPTDVKEAAQIERAEAIYRRNSRIIRTEFEACVEKLPQGFAKRSCRLDVEALSVQRKRQLRGPLQRLAHQVGPRCTPALTTVLAVPASRAGASLAMAANTCRAEYEGAAVRP